MTEVKGYTYHRVFDGYNFLSASGAMEEIVGTDMELVSKADHDAALRRAKAEGVREARARIEHAFEHGDIVQDVLDDLDARAAQIDDGEST